MECIFDFELREIIMWRYLLICLLLSACTIGNGNICGPFVQSWIYCSKIESEAYLSGKTYLDWWEKDGWTPEQRDKDDKACLSWAVKKHGTTLKDVGRAAFYDAERCFMAKGYQFKGNCESMLWSDRPVCKEINY
jgi:hypothetical protein